MRTTARHRLTVTAIITAATLAVPTVAWAEPAPAPAPTDMSSWSVAQLRSFMDTPAHDVFMSSPGHDEFMQSEGHDDFMANVMHGECAK